VLVDPRLQRAMGAHNRRVVEERFSWSRVVDRLEGLYREAIENPNASSRAAAGRPGP
jgi:glycosyltransferase involved in cell wall biosynthesis